MNMDESTSSESFTCFEDLSNEIIYEIFEYLDFYCLYQIFSNLNSRYYNLINHSTFPIKLYVPLISKTTFQNYSKNIIIPNQHRIQLIYSTNPFLFDFSLTPLRFLFQFSQLQILFLENFQSENLQNILSQLFGLSNLSSLILKPIDFVQNKSYQYQQIFRLPILNYCKLSFKEQFSFGLMSISYHQYSSIKHFIIDNDCSIDYLTILLSYLPQLCSLSCTNLTESTLQYQHLQTIILNNLTYLSLRISNLNFNHLELFFTRFSHKIEIFRLTADYDITYLNAHRWEQIILIYLPYLRIFDIKLTSKNNSQQVIPYLNIREFETSFWLKRNWYFQYEYERSYAAFYSIKPYRRKSYELNNYQDTDRYTNKNIFCSINHIFLRGDISKKPGCCLTYFSNINELTLANYLNTSLYSISMILDRIINLTKLCKLSLNCQDFCVSQLMDLLYFSPNIQILIIYSISLTKISLIDIRHTQTFRTIFRQNKITNISLIQDSNLDSIQLFYLLCPRLEQLKIDLTRFDNIVLTTSLGYFIRSYPIPFLFLLNIDPQVNRILQTNLPIDCSIKLISSDLYIWS